MNELTKEQKFAKQLIEDKNVSFDNMYEQLQEKEYGDWDNINDEDIIRQYCKEQIDSGIQVSHILEVLETKPSSKEIYAIWLGNSLETPNPIETKQELTEGLGIECKKFARQCTECKGLFNEGYVDGDDYYCSDKCLHKHYTKEEWLKEYKENPEYCYWTAWECDDDMRYYEDGSEVQDE